MMELPLVTATPGVANEPVAVKTPGKKGVWVQTLGCQMNEHDTEIIIGMLRQIGYEHVSTPELADLILYNTCSVRENPERKLYGQVHMLRKLKEENPNLIIGICGCMTQQKSELERMRRELEHVDLIFGTLNIHRLPELLHKVEVTGERVIEVWHEEGDVVEGLPVQRVGNLKAYVTIIYGCNEFCTYCIVPYVRGKERSRQPEHIVAEIEKLAQDGYKEVTLLGQNVNAYGNDLERDGVDFADLLYRVNEIDGIERIRYMSPHPTHFTQRVIDALQACDKVCTHVHMPAQSGSNRTLRRMGRRYTREQYIDLVSRMKEAVPNLAVTSDFIVGFPGETDDDFEETLSLVREIKFDHSFMFIYSPRIDTPATRLKDWVPEDVQKERIHRLVALQSEISLEVNKTLVGQQMEVLVEGESHKDAQLLSGRTSGNKLVVFRSSDQSLVGRFVTVRITEAKTWSLTGELIATG